MRNYLKCAYLMRKTYNSCLNVTEIYKYLVLYMYTQYSSQGTTVQNLVSVTYMLLLISSYMHVYLKILVTWMLYCVGGNFHQEKIFTNFTICSLVKFLICNFFVLCYWLHRGYGYLYHIGENFCLGNFFHLHISPV